MRQMHYKYAVGCLLLALPISGFAFDQWATKVINFSSQYSETGWSAKQTLKAPNVASYGDDSNAWTTTLSDNGKEFLTLGFTVPVYATGVTVRETYGYGFVTQIDAIDTKGIAHKVWAGTDNSLPDQVNNLSLKWPQTSYLVKSLKISINTALRSGWEEIDAVQLHGLQTLGGRIAPRLEHTATLICSNDTTGQTINRTIKGSGDTAPVTKWDCEKVGLKFSKGDAVTIQITGIVAE